MNKETLRGLKGRSLIEPMDFDLKETEALLDLAGDIIKNYQDYGQVGVNRILGSLFFEPSTRTRLSFEAAMMRLGGKVLGFSEAASSSVAKGESIADTVRTVACYSDILVLRHPKEGAPRVALPGIDIPLINAGDGGHQHPTQTLTDLLTIREEKGRLENLVIGVCGDLKFGRTVHSLCKAMARYDKIKILLISPLELRIPEYIKKEVLGKNSIETIELESLEEALPMLDVLYMTRVQKERFFNEQDYVRLKDTYILDSEKMKFGRSDLAVLHPLPRVNEIAPEVDQDPRALYFKQAKYGMYIRMALIIALLGLDLEEVKI
jgi:aspartate carbamoyltransferase catalytic subunit